MFDPLHEWLGIPPEQQPPNHYRLLGIDTFDSDGEVIDAAADKRLAYLQQMSGGEHAADAEDLSNQVSAARLCLMSPQRKRAYDERLKRLSQATSNVAEPTPAPEIAPVMPAATAQPTPVVDPVTSPQATAPVPVVRVRRPPRVRGGQPMLSYWHYSTLLAVLGLLCIGVALKRGWVSLDPQRAAKLGITVESQALPVDTAPSPQTIADANRDETADPPGGTATSNLKQATMEPLATNDASSKNESPLVPTQSDAIANLGHPATGLPAESSESGESQPSVDLDVLPSGQPLDEAMSLVSELYKEKYRDAKTTNEKISLAQQMQQDGVQTIDDPVGRFALWKVARDILVREGAYGPAITIVDSIGDGYRDVDRGTMKMEVLKSTADKVTGSQISSFVRATTDCMEELSATERFDDAAKLGTFVAQHFGDRIVSTRRHALAAVQLKVTNDAKLLADYQTAKKALALSPDDPIMNQKVGVYLCLYRGRWDEGLKFLAAGPDAPITTVATSEIVDNKDVNSAIAVADGWYDLGDRMPDPQSRNAVLTHAMAWYLAAQGAATGLVRKKIDQRVDELVAKYPDHPVTNTISLAGSPPASSDDQSPMILDRRTRTSSEFRSIARADDRTLVVGIGRRPDGLGQAEAGIELRSVKKLTVKGSLTPADMVTVDAFTKCGFVVDYHTPAGYTRRVFLGLALEPGRTFSKMPLWGTAMEPETITDLGRRDSYDIDLQRWAPKDWDGQSWFSLVIQNAGTDRTLEATLSW
ncbi:hypothetical protein Poly51_26970 [Rubripirellula tenax]|uniref:J domain-containing protein n=1 Tax=Rubripirellula tenax TaxID=2528015 RepID=A0A5C6F857_9BACT|nr:hypothetical protein [Rubripirellula tenax]TWU56780.1 hypothetical protein Poly51_26970 [Rubripirellula tenax]